MSTRLRSLLALAPILAACSVPGWPEFPPYCDPKVETCPPGQDGSSTTGATLGAPHEASGGIQTVTGASDATTTNEPNPPAETSAVDPSEPAIDTALLTPDPLDFAGRIAVEVTAIHATGVRMERIGAPSVDLKQAPGGSFIGEIEVLTGLSNGTHEATFVPWHADVEGAPETVPFSVALPPAGTEVLWDAVPDNGLGQIEALGLLGDSAIVGLGTLFDGNDSRCYLHRRNLDGTYGDADVQIIFPDFNCAAVDLVVAGDAIYLLAQVTGGDGPRWRLASTTWGAAPMVVHTGAKDEVAHALARSAGGRLVACGTGPSPGQDMDTIDGRYWTLNGPTVELDYVLNGFVHRFDETVRDCGFAGERLVLVGEVLGRHEEGQDNPSRRRPFVLEVEVEGEPHWIVPGLGPGNTTQGAATALAFDDQGHYIVGLYTCGDACVPEGELRTYAPGGTISWQVTLPANVSSPFAVAWSPAGYVAIAGAEGTGWSTNFLLQGYVPHTYTPAWTFSKAKQANAHVALAVATAPGIVVGGGFGGGGFPAFAFVRP